MTLFLRLQYTKGEWTVSYTRDFNKGKLCYMAQLSSDFIELLAKWHQEPALRLGRTYHAPTNSIPQNQEVDEDQGPFWGWAVSTGD